MTQGLNELTNHVLEEAKLQAQAEENRGREEAERLAKEYRKATAEMTEAIREEYRQKGQDEVRRIISQAEMETKLRLLSAKQELVTIAFARGREKLAALPEKTKRTLYRKNLLAAVEEGTETVAVADSERGLWTNLLQEVNKELVKKGLPGQLKLEEKPASILGGFLLQGKNFEINGSFEAMLAAVEERLRPEVARILF